MGILRYSKISIGFAADIYAMYGICTNLIVFPLNYCLLWLQLKKTYMLDHINS